MESVEQAVLYVRTLGPRRSIEVAAATELVRPSDLTELIGWFGPDDTEVLLHFDKSNLFFHPLPSGDFALGLIFPAQGGFFSFLQPPSSFFVRVLVVPPRTLLHYANNPLSLYRDLDRRRKIPLFRRPPRRVHPLTVSRRLSPFDRPSVLALSQRFGAAAIARLVQLSGVSLCTFFVSPVYSQELLEVLFCLFPVRFRTELTFATELFFSARTPLRLIGVSGERRQLLEQADGLGIPLLLLQDAPATPPHQQDNHFFAGDAWSRLIYVVLRTENYDFFESRLKSEAAQSLTASWSGEGMDGNWRELQIMGESWLKELGVETPPSSCREEPEESIDVALLTSSKGIGAVLADRSTMRKESVVSPRAAIVMQPRQRELLVQVDSEVTRLLFGEATRLPMLQNTWRELQQLLSWSEKERLREEFIALIHSMLVKGRDSFSPQRSNQNVNLLDVLIVFLGE